MIEKPTKAYYSCWKPFICLSINIWFGFFIHNPSFPWKSFFTAVTKPLVSFKSLFTVCFISFIWLFICNTCNNSHTCHNCHTCNNPFPSLQITPTFKGQNRGCIRKLCYPKTDFNVFGTKNKISPDLLQACFILSIFFWNLIWY